MSDDFARGPIQTPSVRHARLSDFLMVLAIGLAASCGEANGQQPGDLVPTLRAEGRHFVDGSGRVVLLRGANLSGTSKVPPFVPLTDTIHLDRMAALGMNAVRLIFIWEAYEPCPGEYREDYLDQMRGIAEAAWARGLHVIVDFHQDGFSRYASHGAGDGFPAWAVSPRGRLSTPDNNPSRKNWPILMATDPTTYRSFHDFFGDRNGVRTRFLAMVGRVAAGFSSNPGVIGYDVLNEPWGNERRELLPLYRDAAASIRSAHPWAILFFEGQLTTNAGYQSNLPRPEVGNAAYAPHYYLPATIVLNGWMSRTGPIDRAFANMEAKAEEWCAPLFLGEFGIQGDATNAGAYMDYLHDHLDARLASGTQWNVTPGWNAIDKDGWNGEDFNIIDPSGTLRPNFVWRPYPRAVAGVPTEFRFDRESGCLTLSWDSRPELGETLVYAPAHLFPGGTTLTVDGDPQAVVTLDQVRQQISVRCSRPGPVRLRAGAGA
ncbi:cellulase family glycosylhydrolase [Isosphaeraceae bacterium EP7]